MVALSNLTEHYQKLLGNLECPSFESEPWVNPGPLKDRRVTIISSGGIHHRDEVPFKGGDFGYRTIPANADARDIVMSHVSVNFDRTAFQQDLDAIFPLSHLADMAADGTIGSVATDHYSFMGATDPALMEDDARELAGRLQADNVDTAVLIPV
ncbi:MAG: selenoprotein B glycine/betaine/sarcosine/D-proline reductase [Alphaproteobacteria bacterium]|jgi:D-proline reductase (dithiol) PrdB|nr:selenoprotein B glycine/betaine/sarcosine/D-proline reductase [Alphaproteobacteria bacterium]MBT4083631.1 selenoprotein B glycine/betaine/sarcosine/D-proline reductase [Alphaproteobacteria bacterium]MBT4545153.1 selenoprotein B glycine/betaine/sarcosine/D-proline reductase [Alphaproteobacteria bacterium]MBT6388174.1 selenoprotein B glycine/betaine/sarcosine/D-proline reductase [Alphaproteobacteria bacterium]MBT7747924.1 selenoprotein B glycine/betaine/sarcosine/D-proline reductase [Alphaprot